MVRILGSHPRDPGSSPGNGIFFGFVIVFILFMVFGVLGSETLEREE